MVTRPGALRQATNKKRNDQGSASPRPRCQESIKDEHTAVQRLEGAPSPFARTCLGCGDPRYGKRRGSVLLTKDTGRRRSSCGAALAVFHYQVPPTEAGRGVKFPFNYLTVLVYLTYGWIFSPIQDANAGSILARGVAVVRAPRHLGWPQPACAGVWGYRKSMVAGSLPSPLPRGRPAAWLLD